MQQTWNRKYYFEEEQLEYWSLLLSLCYIVWTLLISKPSLPLVLPLPKWRLRSQTLSNPHAVTSKSSRYRNTWWKSSKRSQWSCIWIRRWKIQDQWFLMLVWLVLKFDGTRHILLLKQSSINRSPPRPVSRTAKRTLTSMRWSMQPTRLARTPW